MSASKTANGQQATSNLILYAEEIEYFETHDFSEELEKMPDIPFEISPQAHRKRYSLNAELSEKLTAIARQRGVLAEDLLNQWVQEKTAENQTVSAA